MEQAHSLLFMGTSASCGVPAYYCGCKACQEAREHPEYARGCSSIMIRGGQDTLIDTSPELRLQFVREHIEGVNQVLYTHEHFDHVGGLAQLEYFVRLVAKEPLAIYAGSECADYLERHFDFMDDAFTVTRIAEGQRLEFDGVAYTALHATHCPGAFGYLIEADGVKVAYFPDTGALREDVLERVAEADVVIIDATFNGDNWMPASHTTIDGAIELAGSLKPKRTYLTHLTLHYDTPTTVAELQPKVQQAGQRLGCDIRLAFDGLSFDFSEVSD